MLSQSKIKDMLLKAALINICILTMDQMTIHNVKGIACWDVSEKLYSSPQLYGAFKHLFVKFVNCLGFMTRNFYCVSSNLVSSIYTNNTTLHFKTAGSS